MARIFLASALPRTHARAQGRRFWPSWPQTFLFAFLLCCALTQAQAQSCTTNKVLFADMVAVGVADGSSWANANTLQGALGTANADTNLANCYEIRVKQGIYKPTSNTADRSATFAINRPLQLKGGYSGYTPDERGSGSNTVLSGDIDSNDLNLVGGVTQKASDQQGANSYHVILIGGSDFNKGNGIYGNDSTIATYTLLDGLTISAGNATSGPNFSDNSGGGVYCNGRGAGYICSPSITNMTFSGNNAIYGGAVINSSFSGGTSNPSFINTTFSGNAANGNPGSNAGYGGAIFNDGNGGTSNSIIANCTFSGNSANVGGAIHSYGNAGSNITGSILWGNTANSGNQIGSNGVGSVRNNLVQGGYGTVCTAGMNGTCNLDQDPLLGALADNGGPTHSMMPQSGSPAIDAYTCTTPITDQRGVSRPQGAKCDLGAVERIGSPTTLTVSVNGTGTGTVSGSAGSISGCTASGGSACSDTYWDNTTAFVTLNATTPAGSAFTAWSGDSCVGTQTPRCAVVVDKAKTVTAQFSAFAIDPLSPPAVVYGSAFSQVMTANGGVGSYLFSASNSSNADLTFDAQTATLSAPATLPAGTYTIDITATDSNGASTLPFTVNVTVHPATLTITANDASMVYGQSLPTFTVSYSGWKNTDTAASFTTAPTVTTTATAASPVDRYPITASAAVNPNYTMTYVDGTLTIGQAGQTLAITSTAPTNAKVGGSYTVVTTAGGSTQPVVLSASGGACSMAGAVVSFNAVGTCVITANQAGDSNFTAAQSASQTLSVGKAAQTIAFTSTPPASPKIGSSYTVTTTGGGSTQPVVLSVSGGACSLAGAVVSFNAAGTCVITANQAGDNNYDSAQPVSQTVSVGQAASGVTINSTPNPSLPGQEVTFSIAVVLDSTKSLQAQSGLAKAAPVPTGTVTLTDGTTTLGTAPLDASGNATLTVKTLTTEGTHSIVASYSGDANFPPFQSTAFLQTVSAAPVAAPTPTPVPLFDELWEKLLLSLVLVGVSALGLRMRKAA